MFDAAEIQRRFRPWRDKHARRAWKPLTQAADDAAVSRFGGSPLMARGESWPRCKGCDDPMHFLLQIDLADCGPPRGLRGEGLLQLFHCSRDDGGCETWAPFSGAHLVRLFDKPGEVVHPPQSITPFPARGIEGWREFIDYPQSVEHELLGLNYDYDFKKKRVSVRAAEFGLELVDLDLEFGVAEAIAVAESGDKLGGWPAWVQGVEYPNCPECDGAMQLLLQVDSEDNVPYMFGDAGCGHITQCSEHPSVLAFGWACA